MTYFEELIKNFRELPEPQGVGEDEFDEDYCRSVYDAFNPLRAYLFRPDSEEQLIQVYVRTSYASCCPLTKDFKTFDSGIGDDYEGRGWWVASVHLDPDPSGDERECQLLDLFARDFRGDKFRVISVLSEIIAFVQKHTVVEEAQL